MGNSLTCGLTVLLNSDRHMPRYCGASPARMMRGWMRAAGAALAFAIDGLHAAGGGRLVVRLLSVSAQRHGGGRFELVGDRL